MNRKNYRKLNNSTYHGMSRGKSRLGLSKTETKKMSDRALTDGISPELISGKLKEEVMNSCFGNIRYYANAVYVFNRYNHLITVIKVDPIYEKHLLDYVSYPVYVWYKTNRVKYTRKNNISETIHKAQEIIRKDIINFFKDIDPDIIINDIKVINKKGQVYIQTKHVDKIKELNNEFKQKYRMTLNIQEKNE